LSLATISFGVPAGTAIPIHDLTSKPGNSEAIGGTLGSVGHGAALDTPSPSMCRP
jgi:hypothetical protein